MPWEADTGTYLCIESSSPAPLFYRLKKLFYALIHESRIKLISNQFLINTSSSAPLFSQAI